MYKESVKVNGALRSKVVVETVDETPKRDRKSLARLNIQEDVFDVNDSIADNSKMISLILTIVSRIYDVLDDTQKDNINDDDRALIEYALAEFKVTETRADKLFAKEGNQLVDKLLNRQKNIANILEELNV